MPYQINDLKNIQDSPAPFNLHAKIMRKIYFLKLRAPLMFLIILSIINLIGSSWHFFAQASEMETFGIIQTMLGQFDLSFDYLSGLFTTAAENTPLNLILPLTVNLILMSYLIYLFKIFTKVEKNLNY